MNQYTGYGMSPGDDYWDSPPNEARFNSFRHPNEDLLEAVENAMHRDPDQEFDLLLILERKRD
jgi:hypothetical protein